MAGNENKWLLLVTTQSRCNSLKVVEIGSEKSAIQESFRVGLIKNEYVSKSEWVCTSVGGSPSKTSSLRVFNDREGFFFSFLGVRDGAVGKQWGKTRSSSWKDLTLGRYRLLLRDVSVIWLSGYSCFRDGEIWSGERRNMDPQTQQIREVPDICQALC